MTFEFARPEEGEISLEEAIGQAIGAASTCWEKLEGTGVFDSDRAKEIYEALQVEILRKQKRINDRHEAEISEWKERLVNETASLRELLEDRRGRVRNILDNYEPNYEVEGDVAQLARVEYLMGAFIQRRDIAEGRLVHLEEWLATNLPGWKTRPADPVDAAVELLNMVKVFVPSAVKILWENIVQPTVHVLERYGVEVLPKPKSAAPHKPE